MPDYDLVSVTYESSDTLERFVEGIKTPDNHCLITVVDNNSTDGTAQKLQTLLPHQQLIFNAGNRGYAKAANQGARAGHHDIIVFINPDCFVKTDTLDALVKHLISNPKVGVVGCQVMNEDGSLQSASCRRLPTFWRVFFHQTRLYKIGFPGILKHHVSARKSESVEALNGALFVIRRDLFEHLSGFDTEYPMHFEDLDLFIRSLKAGYHIHYLAQYKATHLKGHSSQQNPQVQAWKKQGLKRYFQKHRPRWEQWIVNRLIG